LDWGRGTDSGTDTGTDRGADSGVVTDGETVEEAEEDFLTALYAPFLCFFCLITDSEVTYMTFNNAFNSGTT
jgi:hypothetical protein